MMLPKKRTISSLPSRWVVQLGRWMWSTMWHLMMSQLAPRDSKGVYIRPASQFRQWIVAANEQGKTATADGASPADRESNIYVAEPNRYRLYVGMGCPWAHRTLVVRALKGLTDAIAITVVIPSVNDGGWVFESTTQDSSTADSPTLNCRTLKEFYRRSSPGYQGRSTVPVIWDSQTQTIVNNESADIIVMLNDAFNAIAQHPTIDLYPNEQREIIDQWNTKIYHSVNNGVYRCGFAQSQAAYDEACDQLFATLDEIDGVLASQRYLCGAELTLADVRLFTTLFRFDIAYHGLFKCDRQRIQDYAHLGPYLRDIYQLPGIANTCDADRVRRDYYGNLFPLNPGQIIPKGPDTSHLWAPHQRHQLASPVKQ